ncbi:MAG: M20/M25/M40 family metallo-hydrolase [Methylococcaceae bacterium]|nr:MAG: M20/M25/M40 family metallo-hydrolase [Methylococcaceae bacterium]
METERYGNLFEVICELVQCHSPSGAEWEIDDFLLARFDDLDVEHRQDEAGNIICRIPGRDGNRAMAITAHKDEIGAIVKRVHDDGRVEVRKLGGAYPWVYGEGVVDLLGDHATISGVLSFGSRHVSHESPQKVHEEQAPLRWENAWIETKQSAAALASAGIRPGSRMVVGKHRKQPFRLGEYVASYTLDNKASLAVLLALAEEIKQPGVDIYLVATAKEEVGAIGAMHFTSRQRLNALIALEISPKSREYPCVSDLAPVLVSQDGYGIYDESLNTELATAAKSAGLPWQHTILSQFGSDASWVMKNGHVPRAACLGFPCDNTHGYEIAHLGGIDNCRRLLLAYCQAI